MSVPTPGGEQQPEPGQPAATRPDAGPPPRKVRPGRIWYLAALAVFLGGAAWLAFGLASLKSQVDSFQRVPLPRGGQVSLPHRGGYVVYYEGPGASRGNVPSFRVRVTPSSAGAGVQGLRPYTTSVTYSLGSRQGRAVLTLRVSHPGRFRVEALGAPPVAGGSDLAFGNSIAHALVRIVVPSVVLLLIGIGGALALLIVRIVLTSRRRAQMRAAYGPPGVTPRQR